MLQKFDECDNLLYKEGYQLSLYNCMWSRFKHTNAKDVICLELLGRLLHKNIEVCLNNAVVHHSGQWHCSVSWVLHIK